MTWRPSNYLLEGELDNRQPGRITGWLRFAGLAGKVIIDLEGDFEPDIRGGRISLSGRLLCSLAVAAQYMKGFDLQQTGKVGHITIGGPPQTWTDYPYLEWYSESNDRVVLYLEPNQIAVMDPGADAATEQPGLV